MFSFDFHWRYLNLEQEWNRPKSGQLVVLKLVNKSSGHEYYEIGCFKVPEGRRKLWWYRDGLYPIDQKRLYRKDDRGLYPKGVEIKWFPLPET